ncbi:MAG: transketolase [Eubacteriaceae bacterium]|nr:transketolase [Eubacteriaceae bacterium]
MSKKNSINALRFLGVDAVNKANSGHPGIVLGAAPMVYSLFSGHLAYNPKKPDWFNRDRFVLSAGHGSALLYSTLHLTGYNLPMEEVKAFRQWGSKTPGHPEYKHTEGVECTTGPLGQGLSMAVGMAIAEGYLGANLNKDGFPMVDHYTYVVSGDGDLQEGVAMEAISLAGHLGLNKLILLFDSNDIQLDTPVSDATSDNIQKRFEAMNWNHLLVEDGEDSDAITAAIAEAKKSDAKPTVIEIKTVIGCGSPKEGTCATHGSPLGEENTAVTRKNLGWDHAPFEIPEEVYADFKDSNKDKGVKASEEWEAMLEKYTAAYPAEAKLLNQIINNDPIDIDFEKVFAAYEPKASYATRVSGGDILDLLQKESLLLIGGSADLASSTKIKGINGAFTHANPIGRNINFGVREHAMAAVVNGLVLHGLKGFCGGFFIFSDYMKPAMRLAALMGLPSIFAFTHDSIAVGEDGPTHEPIEQLAALRSTPNMDVIRPADANEVMAAYQLALESKSHPTSILLTRQNLPTLAIADKAGVAKGAYIISKEAAKLDAIIIATGSEVSLALNAQKALLEEGIDVRVVSMPSFFRYDAQDADYKESVLPKSCTKRVAVEMATSFGWAKYLGFEGKSVTIDKFGASANAEIVMDKYGFNIPNVVSVVKSLF